MSRPLRPISIAALFIVIPLFIWWNKTRNPQVVQSRVIPASPASETVLAAPGRVEGRGQTISLGAGIDGIVKNVFVADGQKVTHGSLLADIACEDIRADVEVAKARADSARQSRTLLFHRHRNEERLAAVQQTNAADAVLQQARDHLTRIDGLYQKGDVSREDLEKSKSDFEVAQADYEKARDEQNLINAGPLPEELSRADAEIATAERSITVATEKLEKCNVRAPISGTILKVMTKAGESYSTLLPRPLFTIADDSIRRVRAEVDERDIGKIKLGQAAVVTADAFPGREFEGQVIEIAHAMQPNSVLSDDPAQKADREVLDVLIELKNSRDDLPLGLRVTARMTSVVTKLPLDSDAPSTSDSDTPSASESKQPLADASKANPVSASPALTNPTGLVLQLGAMKHKENADTLAASVREKGFAAFVLGRKGDRFYRVDVGPYASSEDARVAKDELKKSGFGLAVEQLLPSPPKP